MERRLFIAIACVLAAGALTSRAQITNPAASPGPTNLIAITNAADGLVTNMPMDVAIKEISPGVFALGDVMIDRRERTVSFPARFNLDVGAMEYFLVTSWGKIHESILKTDTQPYRIHVAMLLLGAQGVGTNLPPDMPPPGGFLSHPANIPIPGDKLAVEVGWTNGTMEVRHRASELIYNRKQQAPMSADDWSYNGSIMIDNGFLAQADGSIISLATDWAAMVNNNGPGHDDDSDWTANTNNLPPTNAVVRVTFRLKNQTTGR